MARLRKYELVSAEWRRNRARWQFRENTGGILLFEDFLRRDREAVGDVGRAIGDFEQMAAERAAMFAGAAMPRGELDPAKPRVAFGADDVAFFHRYGLLILGLDIGRGGACIRPLVGIDLRLEIGGPLDQRGGKRRI